jgi:ATP-binding cassette, subfamily C (CFTR/MRP), member 1
VLTSPSKSVDGKTDELMQRVIREKFSNHTIIAVAHKLDTILDFDKVAVLDSGRLVEFDDPYVLLNRESAFSKLYSSAMADDHYTGEVLSTDDMATSTRVASTRSLRSTHSRIMEP